MVAQQFLVLLVGVRVPAGLPPIQFLPGGVMVAQLILVQLVGVQIPAGQPLLQQTPFMDSYGLPGL